MTIAAATHTRGPWTYDFSVSNGVTPEFMVMGPDIAVVAHVWPDEEKGVAAGVVEANARLIAAAPELLLAARDAYEMSPFHAAYCGGLVHGNEESVFDERVGCDCYLGKLRAAINKAEGREQ